MPEGELTTDEALAAMREVDERLGSIGPDHPDRPGLERRRDELQTAARRAADLGRAPEAIRAELDHLERRLAEIDGELIKKSWAERGNYGWINDPGAYAHGINQELERSNEDVREEAVTRISELRAVLDDMERAD
jgi:hypothetical protein